MITPDSNQINGTDHLVYTIDDSVKKRAGDAIYGESFRVTTRMNSKGQTENVIVVDSYIEKLFRKAFTNEKYLGARELNEKFNFKDMDVSRKGENVKVFSEIALQKTLMATSSGALVHFSNSIKTNLAQKIDSKATAANTDAVLIKNLIQKPGYSDGQADIQKISETLMSWAHNINLETRTKKDPEESKKLFTNELEGASLEHVKLYADRMNVPEKKGLSDDELKSYYIEKLTQRLPELKLTLALDDHDKATISRLCTRFGVSEEVANSNDDKAIKEALIEKIMATDFKIYPEKPSLSGLSKIVDITDEGRMATTKTTTIEEVQLNTDMSDNETVTQAFRNLVLISNGLDPQGRGQLFDQKTFKNIVNGTSTYNTDELERLAYLMIHGAPFLSKDSSSDSARREFTMNIIKNNLTEFTLNNQLYAYDIPTLKLLAHECGVSTMELSSNGTGEDAKRELCFAITKQIMSKDFSTTLLNSHADLAKDVKELRAKHITINRGVPLSLKEVMERAEEKFAQHEKKDEILKEIKNKLNSCSYEFNVGREIAPCMNKDDMGSSYYRFANRNQNDVAEAARDFLFALPGVDATHYPYTGGSILK